MIYANNRTITTSSTQEWARRRSDRTEPAWELSWWPEVLLSKEHAHQAMRLTEMCSAREEPGPEADVIATELGTTVKHVMAVLHQRMMERGRP